MRDTAAKTTLDELKDPDEPKAGDQLAWLVRDSFRTARLHRGQATLGSETIETVLRQCHEQYNSTVTPDLAQLMEESGVNFNVSVTHHKVNILKAWCRDLLNNDVYAPFVIKPTPIPDLSPDGVREAQNLMFEGLMTGRGPIEPPDLETASQETLEAYAREVRAYQMQQEMIVAESRAKGMQKVIDDQLVEGRFMDEFDDYFANFALYPYAVMLGPVVERRPFLKYTAGGSVVDEFIQVPVCRNISPFDYFWSPDTKVGGRGSYDIIRERVTKQWLLQCRNLKGWISQSIEAAIEKFADITISEQGMSQNPDDKENWVTWHSPPQDTVTVLRYFGKQPGRVLKDYGIEGVEDDEYVEIEALVLGEWTLRVVVGKQPQAVGRPVHVTAYNKQPGVPYGYGVAQTIRTLDKTFSAYMRAALENAAFSVAPVGECDRRRTAKYSDNDDGKYWPGRLMYTDPDMYGTNRPALTFHTIPSTVQPLMAAAAQTMGYIDRFSVLPAALDGQPTGTGVNRTFRGVAQLYSNALKSVSSAFTNIDKDILRPLAMSYYVYNMRTSSDDAIKGDCHADINGLHGLLEQEVSRLQATELAQVMAPLITATDSAGMPLISSGVAQFTIKRMLMAMGVPEEEYDQAVRVQEAQARQMQQAQAMAAQGQQMQGMPAEGMDAGMVAPPDMTGGQDVGLQQGL